MKYGTVIRLLTVACLAIVQLTGCSSDVEEMEEAAPGIPIRIVAEMNRGGGTSRTVGVPARLSGEWKENYIGERNMRKLSNMFSSSLTGIPGTLRKKSFSIIPRERSIRWQV